MILQTDNKIILRNKRDQYINKIRTNLLIEAFKVQKIYEKNSFTKINNNHFNDNVRKYQDYCVKIKEEYFNFNSASNKESSRLKRNRSFLGRKSITNNEFSPIVANRKMHSPKESSLIKSEKKLQMIYLDRIPDLEKPIPNTYRGTKVSLFKKNLTSLLNR